MKITSLIKLLSLVIVLGFVSCGDNDPECVNGINEDGICKCDEGFEGDLCDIEWRTKFIGVWDGTLSGCVIDIPMFGEYNIPDLPMTMTFTNGGSINTVDINVESTFFTPISTTGVINGDVITIAPFVVSLAAGPNTIDISMSGPGTHDNEMTIDVDVNVEALGGQTNCALELIKS